MKKLILNIVAVLVLGVVSVEAQNARTISYVGKAADLPLLAPVGSNDYAVILGWSASGDGGMQMYQFNSSSALSTNYGVIDSLVRDGGQWIRTPANFGGGSPRTQTVAAASNIVAEASAVRVAGSGGSVTLTSAPTIADGEDGEELAIIGTHDSNTVIVSDEGTLPSSNILLNLGGGSSTNRTLGAGDILLLKFDAGVGRWHEVSFQNN